MTIYISKGLSMNANHSKSEMLKSTRLAECHGPDQGFNEDVFYILDLDVPICSRAVSLVSLVSHLLHILSNVPCPVSSFLPALPRQDVCLLPVLSGS